MEIDKIAYHYSCFGRAETFTKLKRHTFDLTLIVCRLIVYKVVYCLQSEPVHIESKSTQKRVDMRNNTHSFSVNSFYLIVF